MSRSISGITLSALLLAAGAARAGSVVPGNTMPGPLKEVRYDQRPGEQVPLELAFRDEAGRAVKLGDYFGQRPAILVLAYYHCPMLCDMVLQGVETGLKPLSLDPGKDFDVVVVSIDPAETPAMAARKKGEILERYGRPGTEAGWHFLTGTPPSISRLANAVGFHYVYDKDRNEFAHAAGMVILTPQGKVSRYLFGVEYPARFIRLGLVESAGGKIGGVVDQVLLYCFHYDPTIGRYSAVTLNIVRLAGLATVAGLALLIVLLRRRETAQPGSLGAA
ncbi:MAG TPA: SCO family protein [Thermoanaerobaculia bacterium]|nr:SCO family protein [Thermoanaerobaculia bacterium]